MSPQSKTTGIRWMIGILVSLCVVAFGANYKYTSTKLGKDVYVEHKEAEEKRDVEVNKKLDRHELKLDKILEKI